MYGKRNYDVMDYCDYAENKYVMRVLAMAGVRRGRSQHVKQEWDSRCHEPRITQAELDVKLKDHPALPEMTASWNAGAQDATHLAEKMGLRHRMTDAHWLDPWDGMREKLHVMEVHDSSSSEEDDDDVYLDPHVPPPEHTATVMDARVCTLDLLKQQGATSGAGLWKLAKWIDAFLFTEIVDHAAVSELMASLALTQTRKDQIKDREERKRKAYVTTPGNHVMVCAFIS